MDRYAEIRKLDERLTELGVNHALVSRDISRDIYGYGNAYSTVNDWGLQVIVYKQDAEQVRKNVLWDAICDLGSYGYEQGLLEIMGVIVDEKKVKDRVEGYLTADEVMQRYNDWSVKNG